MLTSYLTFIACKQGNVFPLKVMEWGRVGLADSFIPSQLLVVIGVCWSVTLSRCVYWTHFIDYFTIQRFILLNFFLVSISSLNLFMSVRLSWFLSAFWRTLNYCNILYYLILCTTSNTFCGTWYLPHSHVHNDRTVPIIMARCIAHARNSRISTSTANTTIRCWQTLNDCTKVQSKMRIV